MQMTRPGEDPFAETRAGGELSHVAEVHRVAGACPVSERTSGARSAEGGRW